MTIIRVTFFQLWYLSSNGSDAQLISSDPSFSEATPELHGDSKMPGANETSSPKDLSDAELAARDAELAARDAELAARDAIIKSIIVKLSLN